MKKSIKPFFVAATILAATSASAATLVSDNFEGDNTGWFYYNNATPQSIVTDTVLGGAGNNAMEFPLSAFNADVINFASTTLSVGDSLTLSLSLRFPTAATADNAGIRFGIGNQVTPGSLTTAVADTLVYQQLGTGGNTVRTFGVNTATDGGILGTGSNTKAGATFMGIPNDTFAHTLTFTIKLASATTYDLTSSVDATVNSTLAWAPAAGVVTTFNMIAIGQGTTVGAFNIDNVSLVYSPVPEPSSLALAAVGGFGLLALRFRRAKSES